MPKRAATTEESDGLALAALILSILFFVPFAPLVGLVLGIVVLATGKPGKRYAIAAIVINVVYMLLIVIAVLAFALLFGFAVVGSVGSSVSAEVVDVSHCVDATTPDDCYIDAATMAQDTRFCKHVSDERREECHDRVVSAVVEPVRVTAPS